MFIYMNVSFSITWNGDLNKNKENKLQYSFKHRAEFTIECYY